jgi:membrane protein YqaA with SNARE-associated domain
MPQDLDPTPLFDVKRLIIGVFSAIIFAAALVLLTRILGTNFGEKFVGEFGLLGVYLSLLFIDTIPTPGGAIPILTLSVQGNVPLFTLAGISIFASYTAGIIGYIIGRNFGFPQVWRKKLEQRFPNAFGKLHTHEHYGFMILVALPIPMSFATWLGASFSLSFRAFCLGGLIRIPKILIYLFATFSSVTLL